MPPAIQGIGISPGIATGSVKIVRDASSACSITEKDIAVSERFLPPLSSMARRAAGFIFIGSEADHGVSYLKEIWKPAVIVESVSEFHEGEPVTLDGKSGMVYRGAPRLQTYAHHEALRERPPIKMYLQQSVPWMAERAAGLGADGVGLLRTNLLIEEAAKHPSSYAETGRREELVRLIADGIRKIARAFAPKPVWVRTMDFSTDELALLEGGEHERREENPLLGWRGLVRALAQPELFEADIRALKQVLGEGFENIGVIFPLVRDIGEYEEAKSRMRKLGLVPHKDIRVGSMFETPSSVLQADAFLGSGLDLAFLGVNDVTMYTLAADRTNSHMRKTYNPAHPAILNLFYTLLAKCKDAGVETTTSFLSPLAPHLGEFLERGLTSLTVQADRLNEVAKIVTDSGEKS